MKNTSEVWNCPDNLRFQCPQEWHSLIATSDDNVRHCTACDKNVYKCLTPEDFAHHAKVGNCVAIPNNLAHRPKEPVLIFGEPSKAEEQQILNQEKLVSNFMAWWKRVLVLDPFLVEKFMKNTLTADLYQETSTGRVHRGEQKRLALELLELGQFKQVVDIAKENPTEGFLRDLVARFVKLNRLDMALEVIQLFKTCSFKVLSLNLVATELVRLGQHQQATDLMRMSLQTAQNLTYAKEQYELEVLRLAESLGIVV